MKNQTAQTKGLHLPNYEDFLEIISSVFRGNQIISNMESLGLILRSHCLDVIIHG